MVEPVHLAAGRFSNFALPFKVFYQLALSPDGWTSSIAAGESDQFVLAPEVLISSRCRPMAGPVDIRLMAEPVHIAARWLDEFTLPLEGLTSSHFHPKI